MNPPDRSSDARACGGDVAAYALGALEPAEAKAFEAHLETCAVCRDELAAFQTVVDVLPMSAPQHASPRRLRRRVMSTVRSEARTRGDDRGRPISLRRPALALGAVLAVIVVTVAALTLTGGQHTRVYTAQVVGSGGTAEVTVTGNQAQLVVRHFPPPPAGKIYEVWLARRGQEPTPTGALFSVPASGNSSVALPSDLRGVHLVMVTPEPAGGTRVPTHAPIITAALS
ncbi:MAG: anti-sigma factor domain-containing protein [Solirubrobacteraceae bacterium]